MSESNEPTNKGADGRDTRTGRFAPGWKGGPGGVPKKAHTLRQILLDECSEEDMREVCRQLIDQAKAGQMDAIRDLLDRICGKPIAADVQGELDELRARVEALTCQSTPESN